MAMQVRRVVTGRDLSGHDAILVDEISQNVRILAPGHESCVLWSTPSTVAKSSGNNFPAATGPSLAGNTVLRIMELKPGVAPLIRRTKSCDYVIVLSGELVVKVGDKETTLKVGDVCIQKGTEQNWINRGSEPCRLAVIRIDAER